MRENIQQYQESQFSAVEWKVEQIIGELEDDMEDIADNYEPIIDKLQEINDEKERSAELDDLLLAKQNALDERQRVFRQGIGWVKQICPKWTISVKSQKRLRLR